jgi:hypothetical protein
MREYFRCVLGKIHMRKSHRPQTDLRELAGMHVLLGERKVRAKKKSGRTQCAREKKNGDVIVYHMSKNETYGKQSKREKMRARQMRARKMKNVRAKMENAREIKIEDVIIF